MKGELGSASRQRAKLLVIVVILRGYITAYASSSTCFTCGSSNFLLAASFNIHLV